MSHAAIPPVGDIPPAAPNVRRFSKRGIYPHAHWYFALAFTVTIAGFWPSFFLRLGDTSAAHMIHGISATLWMAVPILQGWLITRRQFEWHRFAGYGMLLLAPVLVVSGMHMIQVMLLDTGGGIDRAMRLKFAFLDTGAMFMIVLLLVLAMKNIYQRDVKAHAQYMACTVLVAVEPGLERLLLNVAPGIDSFEIALVVTLSLLEAAALMLVFFDWRSGRVRYAYPMTLAFFLIVHALLEPVVASPMFHRLADWFAAL